MFHYCFSHFKQWLKDSSNSTRLCNDFHIRCTGFIGGVSHCVRGKLKSQCFHVLFLVRSLSKLDRILHHCACMDLYIPTQGYRSCISFCAYIVSFSEHWSQKLHMKAKILLKLSKLKLMH